MEIDRAIELLREYQSNLVHNIGSKDSEPYRVYQRAIEALEKEKAEYRIRMN